MSKGNMLQGQARGKVGDLVFYVRQGQQQTRVRNRQPSNPRTLQTMLQRVKLAGVVGFYKRQASFFKFALKKSAKESYYNAFVRYNLNIAPYLTKEQAAAGYQIAAPYIIADGDMPSVDVANVTVNVSNELTVQTTINSGLTTWGAVRRAYGLLIGDMISFVIFNRSSNSTDAAHRIVAQHVFDQESESLPFGYDVVGLEFSAIANSWSFNVDKAYFGVDSWYATAAAVVTSRNAGGVECSYAQLVLSENAEAEYLVFHSEEQHQEAAASYGSISTAILDPNSFIGNYVDTFIPYGNAAHNTVLTEATGHPGDEIDVYYDNVKFPEVYGVSFAQKGEFNPIESITVDRVSGKFTIELVSEIPETGVPAEDVVFTLHDSNSTILANGVVKIGIVD